MSTFLDWIAKNRSAKHYSKNVAEWYVMIREQNPNLNIYAIFAEIVQMYRSAWSFSSEQIERINSRLKLIAHWGFDLSDYEVLLRFCSDIPYIAGNSYRGQMSQNVRNRFYNAALEGLNEGLDAFRYSAMSLHTTRNEEGIEHHPILPSEHNEDSNSISEADAHLEPESRSVAIHEDMSRCSEEFQRICDRIDHLFPATQCTLDAYEVEELDGHNLARFTHTRPHASD